MLSGSQSLSKWENVFSERLAGGTSAAEQSRWVSEHATLAETVGRFGGMRT